MINPKTMKNLLNRNIWVKVFTLVIALSTIFSCAELDEDPGEVRLAPEALSTDVALESLVTGTYRTFHNGSRRTNYFIAAFSGDDVTTHSGLNKLNYRIADWRTIDQTFQWLFIPYRADYNIITNVNVAIEAKDEIGGDQEVIDRLIGESYFLRGFAYLRLVRDYGRVPLQLEANSNADLFRATTLEIYEQIERDFQQAELLLPDVYPDIPAVGVRPSKGTAKAYLSKLYMTWAGFPVNDASKYAMAAAKAKEVIDNEGTYGFGLTDDFRAMWTENGRFGHNEGVFTIISCLECGNRGNRTTGRLGLTSEASGWDEIFSEIAFFEDMEADAAANGTEQRFNDTYILEEIPRGSNPVGAEWRTWVDPHPIFRKVVGGDMINENVRNTTNSNLNQYFMRYAEVLLNYAEASGRAGNVTADAWESLNRVRRRAGATTDITSGDLAELAYTERKWEFAGEFQRWYDLVRMQRVEEAFANRSPIETVDIVNNIVPATSGEYLYFMPIAQSELDNNPNLAD